MSERERLNELLADYAGAPLSASAIEWFVLWLSETENPRQWWSELPVEVRTAIRQQVMLGDRLILVGGEISEQYRESYMADLKRLANELNGVL